MKKLELVVQPSDRGERLDRFLSRAGGISRGLARRVLEAGGVYLDEKRVKIASRPVFPGQRIGVVMEEPERAAQTLEQASVPLDVLFEDEAVVAVAKPPFVAAQSTLAGDANTLTAQVAAHLGLGNADEVGLVHRLDRETSGVTVFGKTKEATAKLAASFRDGYAQKRYLAIACGPIPVDGVIEVGLAKDPTKPGHFRPAKAGSGISAKTRFHALSPPDVATAVELFPETGRTHQLRVHLLSLIAPILGDVRYGAPKSVVVGGTTIAATRVLLHAESLRVPHPTTGKEMVIRAPVPADLREAMIALGVKS